MPRTVPKDIYNAISKNAIILDDSISHNGEMDFLIDLLKAVGPNGLKNEEYSSFYLKIADTLGKIREEGIWDSRTILQESLLLREYAKNLDDQVEKSQIILQAKDLENS